MDFQINFRRRNNVLIEIARLRRINNFLGACVAIVNGLNVLITTSFLNNSSCGAINNTCAMSNEYKYIFRSNRILGIKVIRRISIIMRRSIRCVREENIARKARAASNRFEAFTQHSQVSSIGAQCLSLRYYRQKKNEGVSGFFLFSGIGQNHRIFHLNQAMASGGGFFR